MERNRPACRNDTRTRVRLLVLALGASTCFLTAQAAAPRNNIFKTTPVPLVVIEGVDCNAPWFGDAKWVKQTRSKKKE